MKHELGTNLKKQNLRMTAARQAIFKTLNDSPKALSAKEVFEAIRISGSLKSDQASVYRNLSLFSDIGLVHRFHDGRYSVCKHDDGHKHSHVHIIANCSDCGKTIEIAQHTKEICEAVGKLGKLLNDFNQVSGINLVGKCQGCL